MRAISNDDAMKFVRFKDAVNVNQITCHNFGCSGFPLPKSWVWTSFRFQLVKIFSLVKFEFSQILNSAIWEFWLPIKSDANHALPVLEAPSKNTGATLPTGQLCSSCVILTRAGRTTPTFLVKNYSSHFLFKLIKRINQKRNKFDYFLGFADQSLIALRKVFTSPSLLDNIGICLGFFEGFL